MKLDELKEQVEKGQAPARLLNYIEPLENWVGRKIGFGKPRYKRFASELKRTEQPVSTWILPASTKKNELEELDLEEVTAFTVGFTSEGTKLLSQILSNKDFPYPKPMSLIKSLVGQATDADSGHIVVDFLLVPAPQGTPFYPLIMRTAVIAHLFWCAQRKPHRKKPIKMYVGIYPQNDCERR